MGHAGDTSTAGALEGSTTADIPEMPQTTTSSSGVDDPDPASEGGEASSTSTGPTPAECAALEPGEHVGSTFDHDGVARTYDLYVPAAYDGTRRLPLVFNLHGLTSNPWQQAFLSQMNAFADEHDVIVVYPAGLGASWNAGVCCGDAMTQARDDVGFIRALAAELQATLCVDPSRTYATGMSNGGFLSHRLACEASDVFAAIAPVAGVLGIPPDDCRPARPIPVMHFHGTQDVLVPYEGSELLGFVSVSQTFEGWAARNGCTDAPEITFEQGDVSCATHDECDEDVEVTLCTAEGDGHCWPGNALCPFGFASTELHASDAALTFFAAHSL
jgi:polyhydroxybutyrate depolymerase